MLTAGSRLGAYEIIGSLGAGGMGDVYRAKDTRLGREVAVKVLSERLMHDPSALARFEREARAVAALSHPNIVALYDVGREGGAAFAVMELLEGRPLHRLLAVEDVTWRTALEIGASIADGLASAHAKDCVHRDLKPANIFIRQDGLTKILDFGLAARDPFRAAPLHADTATIQTEPGAVLGTVGYMSPEQVRGEPADHRSDIFSLGCILYEMLAGVTPFRGVAAAERLAAILRDQPSSLAASGRNVPARVDVLVRRCLEKDPNHRYQSTRDLAFELREILRSREDSTAAERVAAQGPVRRIPLMAALALVVVAGVAWLGLSVPSTHEAREGRSAKPQPDDGMPPSAARPVLSAAAGAYVRGRHALEKRSEPDLRDAIRFFQESVDADPTYAPAYVGLADSYGQLGYGSYISPEDAFPRSRAAARKALALDPSLAEAHASLGYALMYYEWKFAEAEAEYKRALVLNPGYAIAHQWYAYLLTAMERPLAEATREIDAAKNLDPLSVPINIDRAYILHYYGQNEAALRSVSLALEMNPRFAPGYFWLGRIYASEGRYKDAEAALQNIGPLRTWTPAMAVRGYLYAKSGRSRMAKAVLGEFDELARQGRYASGYAIAVIYAGLGDRERVFSFLDAAYRERSHWLVWLKRDPRWNEFRSDPRFHSLVRKVGLPS